MAKKKSTHLITTCPTCNGTGTVCKQCGSTISWFGMCTSHWQFLEIKFHSGVVTCGTCDGTGTISKSS